ncbi:response regulator [Algibacillus agarilyticus]|uniref:response regulator n=1 Tax=Algibacillus agarilyticus TaxID=2234133 RepID=UPI001300A7A9|nr:response regulator [Algibacillus agarilyticus]
MANIVIADNHAIYRLGLKTYFAKTAHNIMGEVNSYKSLHDLLEVQMPDILFYDCYLPYGELVSSLTTIKKMHPNMKIVLITYSQFFHIHQSKINQLIDAVCLRSFNLIEVREITERLLTNQPEVSLAI